MALTRLLATMVSYVLAGAGQVVRTLAAKLSEQRSLADYGVVGDGTDETAKFQLALAQCQGRRLIGEPGKTYLIRDTLFVLSGTELDLRGATVVDDVQGHWPPSEGSRAKPLFEIYDVAGVSVGNFVYRATPGRAGANDEVPTGIFWIGDNREGTAPTSQIRVHNIRASQCVASTLFVSISGNAFDIHVHDISITGNCSYGVNIEYGQAPTGTDDAGRYGLHPYNILVERFNGYNNATCAGFLRVASCYNVVFRNCYGKDVRSFIFAWTGDRSISRVSENVKFENCTHYASTNFLPGTVNYVVQVSSANLDGSTGEPLPIWTNYDHLFTFDNCQFQGNKTSESAVFRFYGSLGSVVWRSCILQGSYYGLRAGPAANPTYTSRFSLTFDDCVFKNNTRDVRLSQISGVSFRHTKFKDPDEVSSPILVEGSSTYNVWDACQFTGMEIDVAWVIVSVGCDYNEFRSNVFGDTGNAPPLDLSAPTIGSGNRFSAQGLARQGWGYYGVLGEPSTMVFDMGLLPDTFVDARKRTRYVALTGAVQKTIQRIVNGEPGDVVVFHSVSPSASVTFADLAAGVSTNERLLTPATGNLVKTGSRWTVVATCTEVGWVLN